MSRVVETGGINGQRKFLPEISELLLSGFLLECPIPQFVIDRSHRVIAWNQALEKYTNIRAETIVGTTDQWRAFYDNRRPVMADLLVDDAIQELPRWYEGKFSKSRLIEGAYEGTDYFPQVGAGGTWLYFTAAPIRDATGKIIGALETLEDITERKRAEEALNEAKAQSELYLDLMGHDINNNDQVAMGYLEIALDRLDLKGDDRELIAKPLEMIRENSRLISTVHKLQQVKIGTTILEPIDLDLILTEVIDRYRSIPGRAIKITFEPASGHIVLATSLLRDVFSNIIINAIRHSDGPLEINLAVERLRRDDKNYYRISIEDNGPGITDNSKKMLFGRLLSGETRAKGKGLGLYLVRMLIDSYGGAVWVEDRVPGDCAKGARFVVMLPAVEK